jgi:thioredoxin-dependent peroxiredoxin
MSDPITLKAGDTAPDFCLADQDDKEVCLSQFKGKWVVFYFYPKDNTPGCTTEAIDFTALKGDLEAKSTVVLGVSGDSTKSHRSFIEKKELGITLLSDQDHDAMQKYGVWRLKKNYGKEYMGVVRSTFLIDPEGKIAQAMYNVKAKGHAEKVCSFIDELQA